MNILLVDNRIEHTQSFDSQRDLLQSLLGELQLNATAIARNEDCNKGDISKAKQIADLSVKLQNMIQSFNDDLPLFEDGI